MTSSAERLAAVGLVGGGLRLLVPVRRLQAAAAEQAIVEVLGVELQRRRRGGIAPRDVRHVGAAVAVIAATARVDAEGQGIDRGLLGALARSDLVDRRSADLGLLGMLASEPGEDPGARRLMRGDLAVALEGGEIGDHRHLVPDRLQRLEDRRQVELRSGGGRPPFVHHHAIGDVEPAEADRRFAAPAPGRIGRHHRIEEGQRDAGADAAQEGAAGEQPG